jgi:hypothetical protein
MNYLPKLSQTMILPVSASNVARIIGLNHLGLVICSLLGLLWDLQASPCHRAFAQC